MFRNIHWNPLIGFSIHTKNLWNHEGKEPWFFFLNHFPHNETCSSRSTNHIFLSLKNCILLTFILTWRCVPREGSTRQFGGLSLNAFSCDLPNTSWKFFLDYSPLQFMNTDIWLKLTLGSLLAILKLPKRKAKLFTCTSLTTSMILS